MIDYEPLAEEWAGGEMDAWSQVLLEQIGARFHSKRYGDLPRWLSALERLPGLSPSTSSLNEPAVRVGRTEDCNDTQRDTLRDALNDLHPWRKGPFNVFGVEIDTEWRSDWKWRRLEQGIAPLEGRRVLDVGCGSGYHCWRMRGAGAAEVIGIDPTPLFVCQFWAMQRYLQEPRCWVLPLGIENVPAQLHAFDTVFSMGVLYHRRSPLDHLLELRETLRPGGQLVLETLVIDGNAGEFLMPEGRYARMGNVWFLPSCATLELWLKKLRFTDIEILDVSVTTAEEQRSTDWMTFHSLADFLDPTDGSKTIEGYPSPKRAIVVANAPL